MQGVMFGLLEHLVVESDGEDAWDDVLEAAGSDGVFTSVEAYDDALFLRLLEHAVGGPDISGEDRLRWFGEQALPLLAERHPLFFSGFTSLVDFLPTLNDVVHSEVRRTQPDGRPPVLEVHTDHQAPARVALGYRSPRRLCALAEGLLVGSARHFGERLVPAQPKCMLRGDSSCLIVGDLLRGAR